MTSGGCPNHSVQRITEISSSLSWMNLCPGIKSNMISALWRSIGNNYSNSCVWGNLHYTSAIIVLHVLHLNSVLMMQIYNRSLWLLP